MKIQYPWDRRFYKKIHICIQYVKAWRLPLVLIMVIVWLGKTFQVVAKLNPVSDYGNLLGDALRIV